MGRGQLKLMSTVEDRLTYRMLRLCGERVAVSSLLGLVIASLLSLLFLAAFQNMLGTLDERIGALPWTLFPDNTEEERVIFVSIDERSVNEIGPWPWSRDVMARLVASINEAGAQLQIHDVLYPVGEREGDDSFFDALGFQEKSIIAQLPVVQPQSIPLQSGAMTHAISGVNCSTEALFPQTNNFIGAPAALSEIPKGHIAPTISTDGSIRKLPALICVNGQPFPALAITPFFKLTSTSEWRARIIEGSAFYEPLNYLSIEALPDLKIPLDDTGNFRISFKKSPSAFLSIPAVDLLNGNVSSSIFDNALVLVGATAFGLDDIVPTPYSGSSPGVELQARVLTSILDSEVPYSPKGQKLILALVCLLFSVALFAIASMRGRVAFIGLPLFAFCASVAAICFHGVLLNFYNIWTGWVGPGLFGFLGGITLLCIEHARTRFERGLVMQNLTSYLSTETARKVAFQMPSSNIQAERCEVTLLSADLRNFSAIGELRPPEESASVLHYFFTKVSEIVEKNGGRIHEYKGDSVLAVWDGNGCGPAAKALAAACEIDDQVSEKLLSDIKIDGLQPLAVGVGIEQGPVLLGSIGPAHRRAHTLCGEAVTVTLRIQEMTADLSYPIIVGEVMARYLPDAHLESLGSYLLPGLAKTHMLYVPPRKTPSKHEVLKLVKGGIG